MLFLSFIGGVVCFIVLYGGLGFVYGKCYRGNIVFLVERIVVER